MMRLRICTVIALVCSTFFFAGCECDDKGVCLMNKGTGTGNPNQPANGSTDGIPYASFKILRKTCEKLSSCHDGLTYATCEGSLMTRTDIDVEVGVPEGAYSKYHDVIIAESEGNVTPTVDTAACLDAIQTLMCSDPTVVAAYDSSATDAFGEVTDALPVACRTALRLHP